MTAFLGLLLQGTLTTLELWILASTISIIFGVMVGTIRCSNLRIPGVSFVADMVTLILRGVPLYAQLMIAYFVLPHAFGISLSAFTTAIIVLGFCSGAYASEIIRGSLNSLPQGQWLAAKALGYTSQQQVRHIIVPQMFTQALPALINEYVMALKSTSIVASIGVLELTKIGTNIMYRSFEPLSICLSIAAIYLTLSVAITGIGRRVERSFHAHRAKS
jgi:His/Glu/Gln/Arg/opine family amino acid ABC transporter permease subunit